MIIQVILFAWTLALSLPGQLNGTWMWAGLLAVLGTTTVAGATVTPARATEVETYNLWEKALVGASVCALLTVAVALIFRSFIYFDTTWDALTYGLTRVLFFVSYGSVFEHQPTQAISIFVNEWNTELIAIQYVLLTGSDQATSFANCEVWLLLVLATVGVCEAIGITRLLTLAVTLLVVTMPAILGLAMTIKGDLLAAAMFLAGTAFLVRFCSSRSLTHGVLAAVAFAIAGGSKITVMGTSGLFIVYISIQMLVSSEEPLARRLKAVLAVGAGTSICMARYIVNLFVYSNPFVHNQPPQRALANIPDNFAGIGQRMGSLLTQELPVPDFFWALGAGLDWVLLPLVPAIILASKRLARIRELSLATVISIALFVTGFLLLAYAIEWRPWSFRYFLPWLLVLLVFLFSTMAPLAATPRAVFAAVAFVASVANVSSVVIPLGETRPIPLAGANDMSQIERKLALWPPMIRQSSVIQEADASILLFQEVDSVASPFFGVDHQNTVRFVDSLEAVFDTIAKQCFDQVVISQHRHRQSFFEGDLEGYVLVGMVDKARVYRPATGCALSPPAASN